MKTLTMPAVVLAALVTAPALAQDNVALQQEHRLREVEVSLWELVAAAMFHAAEPQITDIDGVTPKEEWANQLEDIDEHWPEWRKLAGEKYADVADKFEAEYKKFLELGTIVIDSDAPTAEQVVKMYRQAHKTDDVLDEHLKVKG